MLQTIFATFAVLLIALASGASPALAGETPEAGIQLPEGQWLFEVQILMPMQTEPSVQRFKTCLTSDPVTASTLMPWAESQGCKIRNTKANGDKLTWKLRCRKDGQKSRGYGEFEVDGERAKGKARISFDMGGRRMAVTTAWDANRLGDCLDTDLDTELDTDLDSDPDTAAGDTMSPDESEVEN